MSITSIIGNIFTLTPSVPAFGFEDAYQYSKTTGTTYPVNKEYYASADTALWVASQLGASGIVLKDTLTPDNAGFASVPAQQRFLVFAPGTPALDLKGNPITTTKQVVENAGEFAGYFSRNGYNLGKQYALKAIGMDSTL